MAKDTLIEEIHDRTDVRRTFKEIRDLLKKEGSREDLSELYKQTVYIILMTHSSPWNEKDNEMRSRRESAEREFARTVRLINERAKKIGGKAEYSEDWERIAANGYETEDENLPLARRKAGMIKESMG